MEEKMGSKYVERRSVKLSKAYQESSPSTPLFFILSPGVDPLKDVEAMGEPPALFSRHQPAGALQPCLEPTVTKKVPHAAAVSSPPQAKG